MPNTINLTDATAELMGDGVAVVIQDGPEGVRDVVLTLADAKALVAALEG